MLNPPPNKSLAHSLISVYYEEIMEKESSSALVGVDKTRSSSLEERRLQSSVSPSVAQSLSLLQQGGQEQEIFLASGIYEQGYSAPQASEQKSSTGDLKTHSLVEKKSEVNEGVSSTKEKNGDETPSLKRVRVRCQDLLRLKEESSPAPPSSTHSNPSLEKDIPDDLEDLSHPMALEQDYLPPTKDKQESMKRDLEEKSSVAKKRRKNKSVLIQVPPLALAPHPERGLFSFSDMISFGDDKMKKFIDLIGRNKVHEKFKKKGLMQDVKNNFESYFAMKDEMTSACKVTKKSDEDINEGVKAFLSPNNAFKDKKNQVELTNLLIKILKNGASAINEAIDSNQEDLVKDLFLIIRHRQRNNEQRNNVKNPDNKIRTSELLKFFINSKLSLKYESFTFDIFRESVECGRTALLQKLIDDNPEYLKDQNNLIKLIHIAVFRNNTMPVLTLLLAGGENISEIINKRDKDGNTALHKINHTKGNGNELRMTNAKNICNLLLAFGADTTIKNEQNLLPLQDDKYKNPLLKAIKEDIVAIYDIKLAKFFLAPISQEPESSSTEMFLPLEQEYHQEQERGREQGYFAPGKRKNTAELLSLAMVQRTDDQPLSFFRQPTQAPHREDWFRSRDESGFASNQHSSLEMEVGQEELPLLHQNNLSGVVERSSSPEGEQVRIEEASSVLANATHKSNPRSQS